MQDDSLVRARQMESLRTTILHDDSLRVADLFNKLWAVVEKKDSVLNSQSLGFYKDSFSNLIATHVGLFSALIAVAIAIFIFKYWIDNKKFDEDYKKKLDDEVKEVETRIKSYKEIDYTVARSVYGSMIKSIMKIDESKKCTKDLIELVNAYIALGVNEKENSSIIGFCVVITGLFDRVLKAKPDDELSSCAVSLLETMGNLLDKYEDLYAHIEEKLYDDVLEKFGTEELKEKEKERKRKRDNKRPQKFLDKLKCIWDAVKTIMKGNCAAEGMENTSEGAEGAAENTKNGSEGAEGGAEKTEE